MNLSPHFTLEELTHSDTAVRLGIDQSPPKPVLVNLMRTAQRMEIVRDLLESPIQVSSGYRSPVLNKAVGGAHDSAHLTGNAVDFKCAEFGTPHEIAKFLAQHPNLNFDQLIFEGSWVHIGFADEPRHQVLTAHFGNGPVHYTLGIL